MDTSLQGRSALITGGSLGLGLAMARCYYQAGARVAIVARRAQVIDAACEEVAKLDAPESASVAGYVCDVAEAQQIKECFSQVSADLDGVDILVNNAGQSAGGRFVDVSDEQWQADIDLKLMAAVRLSRLAWPHMEAQRWGRIINLLNVYAKTPDAGTAPTSVTRAAGMALTKVLASEGAAHNILVNAMLIGFIESDQIRRRFAAADSDVSYEEFVAAAGARLPMGRMGEADEAANLALFLASPASSYVTGCAINMDGGLSKVV